MSLHFFISIRNLAVRKVSALECPPTQQPQAVGTRAGMGHVPCRGRPEPSTELPSEDLMGHCYLAEPVVNKNQARPDVETC